MVTQAIYDFRDEAREFFVHEPDAVADIGEDITREAMDRMGTSILPVRLFGRIDYKRARYVFHPEYSVRQALFVDSKAEQVAGARTVTIQTSQTSMSIRQMRSSQLIDEQGTLPRVLQLQEVDYLVTTVFVKYNYEDSEDKTQKALQRRHFRTFLAGRNAPSRGEAFRVRISLPLLKRAANWRVQSIGLAPDTGFSWDE